ncbi:hypothetical protein [Vallitalea okinawensis]|uniref:hypothetical protein n=1 Tax=Vallitalea okinawensis TaxID=2078660 RepID=UPI000CFBC1BE|nr:hypothetical protein [Vallitalea okinawensis]
MKHPFENVENKTLKGTFYTFLGLTILCIICSIIIMRTGPSWSDFGRLSIALSVENAEKIITNWTNQQKATLAFLSGFDFLFGFIWANCLAVGMVLAIGDAKSNKLKSLYRILAWGAWGAIILDIPENLSYYIMTVFKVYPVLPLTFTVLMSLRWIFAMVALFLLIMSHFKMRDRLGNNNKRRDSVEN